MNECNHGILSFRKLIRQMWPNATDERIREVIKKSLFEKPDKVVITTIPEDSEIWRSKISFSRKLWSAFKIKFAISSNSKLFFPLTEDSVFRYPEELSGDLLKIRSYLEQYFSIISDDDPGTSWGGEKYCPCAFAKAVIPCDSLASGAHRYRMPPEFFYKIWQIVFALGREAGAAYVGLNSSEQAVSALPGHRGSGKKNSSFGTYGYVPISLNSAVCGATGVLKPMRYLVPKKIAQEYSMASATAIAYGYKILVLRTVLLIFAVNPPSEDAEIINSVYPGMVESGNTARGRIKTGCICKFSRSTNKGV